MFIARKEALVEVHAPWQIDVADIHSVRSVVCDVSFRIANSECETDCPNMSRKGIGVKGNSFRCMILPVYIFVVAEFKKPLVVRD